MAKGKIGVTTENIFPVIKKFLYSDHEIFLRELVSNAIDATQKLKTLAAFGDYKGTLGELDVHVKADKEAGTLTISDRGIGMDASDIEKYINQIAFSGAEEFLTKYKDTANSIIGHFGLGFYSAFMVSKKVVIRSLSYKEGAKAVEWSCDGSPEFDMKEIEKADRGTDIILYIDDDSKEFLEQQRIDTLLRKYCRFLPVPVISGKEQEWKDGKYVDTDKDRVINASEPLWTKKPADLTDEDYLKFYHELMPGNDDPMFWIHLNVDYPFTLTGILYFPKIKSQVDIRKDRIQLYCNQVYVTDQVEGVVPEFMMLVQGVLDSPDIPLNVSRSYLQADRQVKQISGYISKKVSEKLEKMFKDDRKSFEQKWDDIKIFIEYGMLTDEKFFEASRKFYLFKTVGGDYYTIDEYKALVEPTQTDKDGRLVYLYATDPTAQYSYIKDCEDRGYSVLLMNSEFDPHLMAALESKEPGKLGFVRVDSDIPDRLIRKDEGKTAGITPLQTELLSEVFRSQLPKVEKADFIVSFESLSDKAAPVTVTQNEYMRRMKDMAALQPGGGFMAGLPDNYSLVVNTAAPLIHRIIEAMEPTVKETTPLHEEMDSLNDKIAAASKTESDKKEPESGFDSGKATERVAEIRKEIASAADKFGGSRDDVRQLIDLALLQSGLLKGEALKSFIARSISLL